MDKYDIEDRYRTWWLGKLVRRAGSDSEFKRVIGLEFIAPPSGFVGVVELKFSDDSKRLIAPLKTNAYRPRKKDLEVKEE